MDVWANRSLFQLDDAGKTVHWDFIRCGLASVARFAVTPMQDILGLGSEARMNVPGTVGGHWQWRMTAPADTGVTATRLRDLAELYGRLR